MDMLNAVKSVLADVSSVSPSSEQYGNDTLKRTMYQRKVDVDMLNAVKSVLADVSSVSPSLL